MAASSQGADTLAEAHADAGPKPSTSGEPVAGEASIMATLRDYRLQSYAGPSTYNPFQALAEEDVATSPLEASTLNPEAPAFTPSSLGGAPTDSSLSRAEKKKIRRSRVKQKKKMERSLAISLTDEANLNPGSKRVWVGEQPPVR